MDIRQSRSSGDCRILHEDFDDLLSIAYDSGEIGHLGSLSRKYTTVTHTLKIYWVHYE